MFILCLIFLLLLLYGAYRLRRYLMNLVEGMAEIDAEERYREACERRAQLGEREQAFQKEREARKRARVSSF
jgi:hypothetical protein